MVNDRPAIQSCKLLIPLSSGIYDITQVLNDYAEVKLDVIVTLCDLVEGMLTEYSTQYYLEIRRIINKMAIIAVKGMCQDCCRTNNMSCDVIDYIPPLPLTDDSHLEVYGPSHIYTIFMNIWVMSGELVTMLAREIVSIEIVSSVSKMMKELGDILMEIHRLYLRSIDVLA